jgi:hypothetical protein
MGMGMREQENNVSARLGLVSPFLRIRAHRKGRGSDSR